MDTTVRVLLVDACAATRIGLRQILEQARRIKIVGEAGNGATALKLVEQKQPDLIVLDSRLPDLLGRELVPVLLKRGSAARVLVFSAYEDEDEVRALVDRGAAGYVLKDEPPEMIVEAVQSVATGRQWFSQRIASKLAQSKTHLHEASQDLTERELEVLDWLAQGLSNQEIANRLKISKFTVRYHVGNIFTKLGLGSRGQAMAWAHQNEVARKRLREAAGKHLSDKTG